MKIPYLLLAFSSILTASLHAANADEPNVVIENDETVFRFIADKDGTGLNKIEETKESRLRARRYAETAMMFVGYDDDLKLDKVAGGKQTHGSTFGNDVFYSDSKGCIVEMPLKKAGDDADFRYKRSWLKPEFCAKVILYEKYPIEKASVRFIIPQPLARRYSFSLENCEDYRAVVKDTVIKDERHITFSLDGIPGYEDFADAPHPNISAPKILIRGHFRDVDELYRYLYGYIPATDPGAAAVKTKAGELTAGMTDDFDKISAIYDYVHSAIRYIAVENGELGHRPDLASEVLKKLYGDCKGSAILLRDMLRSVGIDSRLVWIGVQNIKDNWSDNPNISSGNHMIAAAFVGDSTVYLDGTAKYNTINVPPVAICGRQAMIENGPEKCLLKTVPIMDPRRNSRLQSLSFIIDGNVLKARGEQIFKGSHNTSFHHVYHETPASQRFNLHQNAFGTCMANTRDENAECVITADSVVIKGTADVVGCITQIGDKTYVDLNDAYRLRNLRFATKGRHTGGEISAPQQDIFISHLTIPENYVIGELPRDFSISNRWIDASLKYQPDKDGSSLRREVIVTRKEKFVGRLDMDAFNKDIMSFQRACASKIILNKL